METPPAPPASFHRIHLNIVNNLLTLRLIANQRRYDLLWPAETNHFPMFRLLGTPESQKRSVMFDAGHVLLQQQDMKETLGWFDTYLGATGK